MLRKAFVFIGFLLVSQAVLAEQSFVILDGAGNPVSHAVVMADGPVPAPSDTPMIMDQVNKAFRPHVLTVPVGQAVEFPNSDDIRHHVYSFSDAKPFEIKLYKGKPGAPVIFDQPGIVVLGCNIHDDMVGYILVSDTQYHGQSGDDGKVTLPVTVPVNSVRVWHPRLSADSDRVARVSLDPEKSVHRIKLELQPEESGEASGFGTDRFKRYAR